jgi:hypothetical protein
MGNQPIHIVDGKKNYFFTPQELILVSANGNYCDICLTNTVYKLVRIQIGQLWQIINEQRPIMHHLRRAGRSYIINLDWIQVTDTKSGTLKLKLTNGLMEINDIPRKHIEALLEEFSKIENDVLCDVFHEQKVLRVRVEELNEEHPKSDGFEYVDLGLPSGLLWATQNLNESFLPQYFAWGEKYPSGNYDWPEYIHSDEDGKKINNTHVDSKYLLPEYDAARQTRGGGWRIPTSEEFEELKKECHMSWCKTKDGKKEGTLVTGPNGNRIFLPAYGMKCGSKTELYNERCHYWSSKEADDQRAKALNLFELEGIKDVGGTIYPIDKCFGLSIRPVISPEDVRNEEKKKMRVLFWGNMCPSDDDTALFDTFPEIDGWEIKKINLEFYSDPSVPSDSWSPERLMKRISKICDKYKPDAIVGYRASCFFCKQFNQYKRFLWQPDIQPSDELKGILEYYEEYESEDQKTIDELKLLITQYEPLEEKQSSEKVEGDCWVIDDWDYVELNDQYSDCNIVSNRGLELVVGWGAAYMFPLINEVLNGTYKDAKGRQTPYGMKYDLW